MWSNARAWRRIVSSIRRIRVTSWKLHTRPTVRPATFCGDEYRSNMRPSLKSSQS